MNLAESLDVLASNWVDTPEFHERAIIDFDNAVLAVPELAAHRKWVEDEKFGFGHRAFHWVWALLAKELPDNFKFLELGVYKAQALSATDLASHLHGKNCITYGISTFDGFAGNFYERKDYLPYIEKIYSTWNGNRRPILWKGFTQDEHIKKLALENGPYDVIYIDANHEYQATKDDLEFYAPLVKSGGYLITDDSAMSLNLFNWAFKGFQGSSDAVDEMLSPKTENNKWIKHFNIMHLRGWKKV